MAVVVKVVNTPDCGSGIREFESRQSPHFKDKDSLLGIFFYFIDKNSCYHLVTAISLII